ncbi:MAG: hypothetical protein PWP22_1245 [Thermoanaerobacter sp.]|nr:hypothetical protein [Thermoanaerobacter sp.]
MKRYNIIAVISYYPDARFEKEVESLVRSGYNVTVVAWDRRKSEERIYNNTEYRLKIFNLVVPPGSPKVAIFMPIWWLFVFYHLSKEKWDVAHAVNLDTIIPVTVVSRIKRKPVIYDIYDFYADTVLLLQEFPLFRKLLRRIERIFIKLSEVVVIADDSRREQIGKNIHGDIIIVYNAPKEDNLEKLNISETYRLQKLKIFFGGGVHKDRNIDKIIMSVSGLSWVELVVMGPTEPEYGKKLREISSGLKNVNLYLRHFPHSEIIKQTRSADILFALYDSSIPNNKYASPNKLFEAMMCKKPIIVSKNTSMASFVQNYRCGVVVDCNNIKDITEAILELWNNPKLRKKMGYNGRKAYEKKYNWKIMEERLLKAYKKIL